MLTVQNGGTRYAGNGFTFAAYDNRVWSRVPEAGRFQFHPKFAKGRQVAQYTLCPTLLASPDLFPLIKEQAAKKLDTTDWIEENWEPHMFEKRGCVCERCKRAFQEFSRLPASRVESLWPDCVVDMNNEPHNQFTAHQMAQAMLTFDRAWREASRELGRPGTAYYVPAVPPHIDFTPDSEKFKIRGASEYLGQLNALTMWGVPFAIKLGRVDLPSLVGHNLVTLDEIRKLPLAAGTMDTAPIRLLWLSILSRYPTASELQAVEEFYGSKTNRRIEATQDLVWALISSKEFSWRH